MFEIENSSTTTNYNTRNSSGGFVSTDHQIGRNSSGASSFVWNIGGTRIFELAANTISGSSTSTGSFGRVTIGAASPAGVLNVVSNATSNHSNLPALNIDQDQSGAKGLFIATDTTTQSGIQAEANSLTTGRVARFYSNSTSTGTRNLVEIINDHASSNMTTALRIQQDAPHTALDIDAANTADWAVDIQGAAHTTAGVLYAYSNSDDTGTRNLVEIHNDHASATGATALKIQQDSTFKAVQINAASTTNAAFQLEADSLTTGPAGYFYSNASNTSARNILQVVQDHASATGAVGLYVRQDSTGPAIVTEGRGYAISGSVKSTGSFQTTCTNAFASVPADATEYDGLLF